MADRSEFLAEAKKRLTIAQQAESKSRIEALDDLRFKTLKQWPEGIEAQRALDKKPCLTLDQTGQYVRNVTNDLRQNRPEIQVNPVDSNSDPDTAEILQGLIRHIRENSSGEVAVDTAATFAAIMGFGYFRLRADYCDPMSFDQDILFEAIRNPFTVFLDPSNPDNPRWGFIVVRIPKAQFESDHPNAEATTAGFDGLGDQAPGWYGDEDVQVAEYYRIEFEKLDIALLPDGKVIPLADVPEGVAIIKTRKADVPKLKWAKITGTEVLEEKDLPGDMVPIFEVCGEDLNVQGERWRAGVIRPVKSAQMQYNFMASAETEAIALAPKAPYKIAEGQIEGYEEMWKTANAKNYAALIYKPMDLNGNLVPPPQRETSEPAIQAISHARMAALQDMHAGTGIYPPSLGARSNETSGKAILARQREGDNANFHFADNVARALKRAGRLLLKWIPVYYDTERVVRIIGEEGDQKTVTINGQFEEKPGVMKLYDLTTGKYDVTISVGPSYSTKRQEAAEHIMGLIQAFPQIMQVAGDQLVEMQDWPGAKGLAARLKKILPPELQEDDGKSEVPPIAQAKLQASAQLIEKLTQEVQVLSEEIRTKKYELESKERIEIEKLQVEREKIQADLAKAQAQMGSQEAIIQLQEELAVIKARLEMEQRQIEAEQASEQAEADRMAEAERLSQFGGNAGAE